MDPAALHIIEWVKSGAEVVGLIGVIWVLRHLLMVEIPSHRAERQQARADFLLGIEKLAIQFRDEMRLEREAHAQEQRDMFERIGRVLDIEDRRNNGAR